MGGTSLFGLGGALVLETTDEDASARTLDQLAAAAQRGAGPERRAAHRRRRGQGSPSPPPAYRSSSRSCSATTRWSPDSADSVEDVLSPSSTLGDSDAFSSAADALGEDFAPVAFVDFVPLLQLVESFPQVQSDPDYQSAKPYLDHLDYFVLGGRREGDRAEVRMVLGLRDAPAETGGDSEAAAAVVGE